MVAAPHYLHMGVWCSAVLLVKLPQVNETRPLVFAEVEAIIKAEAIMMTPGRRVTSAIKS